MRRLHILEDPRLHNKPADAPIVHVIWEPDEYAYWSIGDRGELIVWRWTGQYINAIASQTAAPCCVVEPGMHFKVWDEDVEVEPTDVDADMAKFDAAAEELIEPDFAIERAQPGHDGFSEEPHRAFENVEVQRAMDDLIERGLVEYVEPEDQKTQIIDDPMVTQRHVIDVATTTELVIPSTVLRTDARPLDWGTLQQPLVVPENISFFNEPFIEEEPEEKK